MAKQQWQIEVVKTQRADVDVALVVSAIMALGEQLAAGARQSTEPDGADAGDGGAS